METAARWVEVLAYWSHLKYHKGIENGCGIWDFMFCVYERR